MSINENLRDRPQHVFLFLGLSFGLATVINYFMLGDSFSLIANTTDQSLAQIVAKIIGLSLPGILFYALVYSTLHNYNKPTNGRWNQIHFYSYLVALLLSIGWGVYQSNISTASEGGLSTLGIVIGLISFCPFFIFIYNVVRSLMNEDFGRL